MNNLTSACSERLCFFETVARLHVHSPAKKGENGKSPFEEHNAAFRTGLTVTASCQQVDEQHK